MTGSPKWIEAQVLAAKAVQKMEEFSITSLFVYRNTNDGWPWVLSISTTCSRRAWYEMWPQSK
jgi:hypothetical protein